MRTWTYRPGSIQRQWYIIDAEGLTLGRLATKVASVLRGKHRPQYSPHADCGDHVIVINAGKVHVTGRKEDNKIYYHHTGFIGGIKSINLRDLREKHPERIIENAVRGMLPKNPLGRSMFGKMKVYAGDEHPHTAQQPKVLSLDSSSISVKED
ncbi:MAG: 50S ribosomal protein L13 [Mariprofundales bacterium]